MDKKNLKQEVLQPVLARFSRILDDIDHSVHTKYKKKLQESGVASSIQILALNDKLSKTMEERAEEIGRRLTPWRYPQEEYKDKNGITAQCPSNKQIIIQYGFDISTSVFSDAPVEAAQQPDGKRFIKVGNLKGQLIPQLAKIVPNKWGANNMSILNIFPMKKMQSHLNWMITAGQLLMAVNPASVIMFVSTPLQINSKLMSG